RAVRVSLRGGPIIMLKPITVAMFAGVCLVSTAGTLSGSEPVRMELSPSIARAPALVTVKVVVEPAADDRWLQVVAESADFYRSSQIQLDGLHTYPVQLFQF